MQNIDIQLYSVVSGLLADTMISTKITEQKRQRDWEIIRQEGEESPPNSFLSSLGWIK